MTVHAQDVDTRQRILDVGAQLFLDRGYADTTLRRIGDEVGLRAASIYYHFASKDDLLTEILRIGIEKIAAAYDEAMDGVPIDGDTLARAVAAHLSALFELGPYTAAHVLVFRAAPEDVRNAIVPLRDDYERRWQRLLIELADQGLIDGELDLALIRLSLLGAMNASLEWFDPDGRTSIEDLAAVITRQVWSGIAAE